MNELVESCEHLALDDWKLGNFKELTLGLLQHGCLLLLFGWQASQESIHIKGIKLTAAFLLFCRPTQILSVRVE